MDNSIQTWVGIRQPFSAFSHYAGLVMMLYVTALLRRLSRHDLVRHRAITVFGLCACLLYGISAAYHTVQQPPELIAILRRLDFSAIFLLIAGTWTALFVVLPVPLRGRMWLLIWIIALAGMIGKLFLPLSAYPVTLALYILLALLGFLPVRALRREIGLRGILLGALGGLFYLIGGICDVLKWPVLLPGVIHSHELLHVMDLLGTMTHVTLIVRYVVPERSLSSSP